MGETFFIFLLTISNVSLLLNSAIAVNPKKGFSMRMIHRDSKESPLYPCDLLTRGERLQRLVKQSKALARYIESQILLHNNATLSMKPDIARLLVVYEKRLFYVATIGLGMFPGRRQSFMNYYLMIDSGSDWIWLQCEGSTKAYTQDMPLYPWKSLTAYCHVPCNTHPVCKGDKCNVDGQCTYVTEYENGSVISGIFAEEKFTLGSDTGGTESIQLNMGCSFLQQNFEKFIGNNHLVGKPYLIVGILGLGSEKWYVLNQLGVVGQGKISYLFETFNPNIEGSNTYLRFGADAKIGGVLQKVHTTPIVVPEFETSLYYLNLEDISVGNKRVGFPRNTFKINNQRIGGAIIDSGAPISIMYKSHFDNVADLVKAQFKGETDTPAFTLGAMQQTNKRILYNVTDRSLSFATDYCELDS